MSFNFPIGADATEFNKVIDASERRLDALAKKSAEVTGMTEKQAKISFNKVLGLARLGWSAMDQVFTALGFNLGQQVRLIIQAAFSTITALTPIITAEYTLGNVIQAAFASAQIGIAITSLLQAQAGQRELATQTYNTATAIYGVGTFLSGISYL